MKIKNINLFDITEDRSESKKPDLNNDEVRPVNVEGLPINIIKDSYEETRHGLKRLEGFLAKNQGYTKQLTPYEKKAIQAYQKVKSLVDSLDETQFSEKKSA